MDPSICLEGENDGKNHRNQRRDLNRGHPEYEAVVLNIQPRRLEIESWVKGLTAGGRGTAAKYRYCHVFMAPWLIITGFGLDDSCTIIRNRYQLQQLTINLQRTLLPWQPRTRPFSFSFDSVLYHLYGLETDHRKHIRCPAMDIWNHTENTSCDTGSTVVFTAPLHSNGSYPIVACVFVAAGMCLPSRCLEMGLHVTIHSNTDIHLFIAGLCSRRK
jgi:hypothetical protein